MTLTCGEIAVFNFFRKSQILALLLVLFAWFIGLYNLGDTRLGADELKTIQVVKDQAPLTALTHYYSYNHIPYAFLLTVVYQFTNKLFMLRLVGVTFGLLAVTMTYRLVKSLTQDRLPDGSLIPSSGKYLLADWLAFSTALLLTVTPIFARYYREMRGYSITVFLGLVIFFSLWQLVNRQGNRWAYWIAFVLAAVGCVYTHFFTLFALAAATLLVLGESATRHYRVVGSWSKVWPRLLGDNFLRSFFLSLVVIAALLAGLLGPLVAQILAVPNKEELSAPEFGPVAPSWQFIQSLLDIARSFSPLGNEQPAAYSFLALALLGSGWGLSQRPWRRSTLWLLTWAITPFAVNLITLNFVAAAQIRYYLLTLPAYLLLGLFGLLMVAEAAMKLMEQRRSLYLGSALAGLSLLIIVPATIQLMSNLYRLGVDQAWTSVAAYLRTEVWPDDIVLCEVFELTGGDEGKCRWHLNEFAPLTPMNSTPYLYEVASYRTLERLAPVLQKSGRIWFVLYFRQPPSDKTLTLASSPGFAVSQIGRTWVIRVEAGSNRFDNLIACGEWLLEHLPDEDHQFRYRLDLAQLYALTGDQEAVNRHLQQAFQLQQQSNEAERLPELRTVAALVRFYAPANPVPQQPLAINFDNYLKLVGYSLEPASLSSHQTAPVRLSLYWQVMTRPERDYTVFVHLTNASGQVVTHLDFQPFDAIYPTSFWPAGAELREARQFALPGDLPPGEYTLVIGLYLPNDLSRLRILDDASGQNAVSLGRLLIEG